MCISSTARQLRGQMARAGVDGTASEQDIRLDLGWGPAVEDKASSKRSIRINTCWTHTWRAGTSPPTPYLAND